MLTKNEFIVFVHLLYSDSIFHQKQNIILIKKGIQVQRWFDCLAKLYGEAYGETQRISLH